VNANANTKRRKAACIGPSVAREVSIGRFRCRKARSLSRANFKDGVLEITMPAPPEQVRRGRRLEIAEEASTKK
jgi:hypothetical protein